jgi:hypothetical protein
MAGFLPSAQFVRVVGALVVVIGGITLAYYLSSRPSAVTLEQPGVSTGSLVPVDNPLLQQAADIDTDQDGLRDWEERLWKTNVLLSDSDGDGTTDGSEIESSRNPLVKGPNDSIRDTINLSESLTPETLAALTPTERIAREFFVEYLSYKKGGEPLSQTEKQQLLFSTIRNSAEAYSTTKTYTSSDITLTKGDDASALRLYGNTLGNILLKHSFVTENELALLEKVMRTQDAKDLATIKKISDSYAAMVTDIVQTSVPPSLQEEHTALINQMQILAQESFALTLVLKDPIQTMLAVTNYETNVRNLLVAIESVQTVLTAASITYGEDETGIILMNIRAANS